MTSTEVIVKLEDHRKKCVFLCNSNLIFEYGDLGYYHDRGTNEHVFHITDPQFQTT